MSWWRTVRPGKHASYFDEVIKEELRRENRGKNSMMNGCCGGNRRPFCRPTDAILLAGAGLLRTLQLFKAPAIFWHGHLGHGLRVCAAMSRIDRHGGVQRKTANNEHGD